MANNNKMQEIYIYENIDGIFMRRDVSVCNNMDEVDNFIAKLSKKNNLKLSSRKVEKFLSPSLNSNGIPNKFESGIIITIAPFLNKEIGEKYDENTEMITMYFTKITQ